jgi:hypothetical protein
LVELGAIQVIFQESGGACHIKMILETRAREEYSRGTDRLEIGVHRRGKRTNYKADLVFRADVLRR